MNEKIFGYFAIAIIIILGTLVFTGLILQSDIMVLPVQIIMGVLLLFVIFYAIFLGYKIVQREKKK
jgi:hypothetical protein